MPHLRHSRPMRRPMLAAAAGVLLIGTLPLAAVAAPPQNGFKTLQAPMLMPGSGAPLGTEIKALITVGDTIGDYRFESIPDGISYWKSGKSEATVLVNHETSTVPFPYGPNNQIPTNTNSFNDFDNSQLSELVIRKGGQILSGEMVIDSGDGYHRFCSNFLATTDGFEDMPLLFTNEEGIDWVYEAPITVNGRLVSWNNDASLEGVFGARQIGAVIAYNPDGGAHKPIWGMGRHNHENSVAIPGYGYPVLLSGDDSFNQNRPQSQLYAYIAEDGDAEDVWSDDGDLWAFAPDDEFESVNDYYDFPVGTDMSISGHFVKVPKDIAMGKLGADADARDLMSTDFVDHPLPPDDGSWQRAPRVTSGPGIDGPQWVLEHWGDPVNEELEDYGNNIFQFLRVEDIAFDKRPDMSNVVYIIDSGRGLRPGDSLGFAPWRSTNGRVWKMVLDENDPTVVESLSILIEGDDHAVKTLDEIHQPDNIESTVNGLYITEDGSSSQAFTVPDQGLPNATTNRVWQYRFDGPTTTDGTLGVALKIDQSADEGPTDVDESGISRWGDWEASGIIDVSSVFGPGKFLVTVQAHTLYIEIDKDDAPDNVEPLLDIPDWQYKREGGQLLLVTIPGG